MMAAALTRIRFRILAIVLLAVIPAVALICYSAAERKRQMSAEIEGNALRLSRFLANNLERDLSEGEAFLVSVGEVLRAKGLLDGGCGEAVRALRDDSSVYADVGLAGADGRILCAGGASARGPGLAALDWFRRAGPPGGYAVGFDLDGGLDSEAAIVLALPVRAGAGPSAGRRYVYAVMELDWLNRLAEGSRLPPGSAISVTNGRGDAVARYPDPGKWVGKSRQAPAGRGNPDDSEGTRMAKGIDGVRRLYAYAKVRGAGGLVVNLGLVREALLEPANRALREQLAALGAVTLLALLAAWFGADVFLLKQVRALIAATRQLAAGNLQARSTLAYGSGELGELARAFDEMAETLQWREAQLRESERERADPGARLLDFVECVPEPFLVLDEALAVVAWNAEARRLFAAGDAGLGGRSLRSLCPDLPFGEAESLLSAPAEPEDRAVRRARSRLAGAPGGDPRAVDVSLTRIRFARKTFILALLKRASEAIAET